MRRPARRLLCAITQCSGTGNSRQGHFCTRTNQISASLIGTRIATIGGRRKSMPATRTLAGEVSQENRGDHPVVQHLQRQVANAFVLYANYKHYHWQTFGPLFRDLHLMFDEFAKDTLGTIDEMAERV